MCKKHTKFQWCFSQRGGEWVISPFSLYRELFPSVKPVLLCFFVRYCDADSPSGRPCEIQSVSDDKITCRTPKHEMNSHMSVHPGENKTSSSSVLLPFVVIVAAVSLSEQSINTSRHLGSPDEFKASVNKRVVLKMTISLSPCCHDSSRLTLMCCVL